MKKIYNATIAWTAKYTEAEQTYSFQPQLRDFKQSSSNQHEQTNLANDYLSSANASQKEGDIGNLWINLWVITLAILFVVIVILDK